VARFTLNRDSFVSGSVTGTWTGLVIVNQEPTASNPAQTLASTGGVSGGNFNNVLLSAGTYYAIVGTYGALSPASEFTLNLSAIPAGSSYLHPKNVSLPILNYQDHTNNYGNNYSDVMFLPASVYMSGNDFVLRFEIDVLSFLSGSVSGSWTGLGIINQEPSVGVPAPLLEIVGGSNGGSFTELVLQPGVYFAVVSTFNNLSGASSFTLNLSSEPVSGDPEFLINPPEHDFGNLLINDEQSQTFIVSNTAGGSMGILSISVTGDPDFSLTNLPDQYPVSLTINQSLSFEAVYNPASVGNHSATISITDDLRTVHTVILSGSASDPTINSYPFSESFEEGNSNGSEQIANWYRAQGSGDKWWKANTDTSLNRAPRTGSVNLTLAGNGDAWIFRPFLLQGGISYTTQIWVRQDNADSDLASLGIYFGNDKRPEAMTTVVAAQSPISNGSYQKVWGNYTPHLTGIYYLGIRGLTAGIQYLSMDDLKLYQTPQYPIFVIDPDGWNFGATELFDSKTQDFSISNDGGQDLTINSISLNGDYFALQDNPAPVTLAMGESASFSVIYSPQTQGLHNTNIMINDNRTQSLIPLSGEGVDARIVVLPHVEDFDSVVSPALPLGWDSIVQTSSYGSIGTSMSNPQSSPNNIMFSNAADIGATLILVSPQVIPDIRDIKLSFWARGSQNITSLVVGTISDPTDPATFTAFSSYPLNGVNTRYVTDFGAYGGTDCFLAFKGQFTANYYYMYLDDVLLNQRLDYDLAATDIIGPAMGIPGTALEYQIKVRNNGLQSINSYNVKLMDLTLGEIASVTITGNLAPETSAIHTLTWTPGTADEYHVYGKVALAADEYLGNDETQRRKRVNIFSQDASFAYIGDPASTVTEVLYPINVFYRNSVSESIYLAHEIDSEGGFIHAIVFENNFVQDLTKPIRLWLQNTEASDLSTSWMPTDNYSLVFAGNIHFPLGVNSVVIPLDVPFQYTGSNLALRVYREFDNAWSNQNKFYYTPSLDYPHRTRYHQADGTAPFDPIAIPVAGSTTNNVPNTTIVFDVETLASPELQISISDNQVHLGWDEVPRATSYLVFASDNPNVWPAMPLSEVFTNSFSAAISNSGFYRVVALSNRRQHNLNYIIKPGFFRGVDNSMLTAEPPAPLDK
jgi:hypothetical protein